MEIIHHSSESIGYELSLRVPIHQGSSIYKDVGYFRYLDRLVRVEFSLEFETSEDHIRVFDQDLVSLLDVAFRCQSVVGVVE